MRWVRFRGRDGGVGIGVVDGQQVRVLTGAVADDDAVTAALAAADLRALIAATPDGAGALDAMAGDASTRPLDEVQLLAPIPDPPKNIVCVGRNFYEHAIEAATYRDTERKPPAYPMFFTKPRPAIVDPDGDVRWDADLTAEYDYEGEVAAIIGRGGRDIAAADAMEHVWGYSLLNDLTARDLQLLHGQYYKGKGLDDSAPFGPAILERRDVPDIASLELSLSVNGELRQRATLDELIFDIPALIASWSRGMTLEPGDVLATGTPAGVGKGMTPPRYLADGDVMEVVVPEIGVLRNTIRRVGAHQSTD